MIFCCAVQPEECLPLILVGAGKTLQLRNVIVLGAASLPACLHLGPGDAQHMGFKSKNPEPTCGILILCFLCSLGRYTHGLRVDIHISSIEHLAGAQFVAHPGDNVERVDAADLARLRSFPSPSRGTPG